MIKDKFSVLLVSPPIRRIKFNLSGIIAMQPLGIACLAAYLRERGLQSALLDAVALRLSSAQTIEHIISLKPAMVGFSTTIFNIADTHLIIKKLKQQAPEIITVLGGYGVVFPPDQLGNILQEVDFFIKGEGEEALYQLAMAIKEQACLDAVPGIIWRKNSRICSNPSAPLIDVNKLPLPALDLLPQARYGMHPPFNIKPPLCLVETARGCGWKCNFCSLSQELRQKNVSRVLKEIEWAQKVFKANEIHFVDPTFTAGKKRLLELTMAIQHEFPGLAWTCKSRFDLINIEVAQYLSESGCYMVCLGIESGSQKILNTLNKGALVRQIKPALKALKKYKIRTLAYIMFGGPGETEYTVKETMKLLTETRPDYVLFAGLMPDPLSELLRLKMTDGKITTADVFQLYYQGQADAFNRVSFTGIPKKKLEYWVKKAYIQFYLNPFYLAERFLHIKNLKDMLNLSIGAGMLFRDTIMTP